MRFRTFEWPQEPASLEIRHDRCIQEIQLADGTRTAADGGACGCVIEGEGAFIGADAHEQFRALQEAAAAGEGVLLLTGMRPFRAVARRVVLVNQPAPNRVEYSFVFVEVQDRAENIFPERVQVRAGETLWDFAFRFDRSIDELVGANPQIAKINALREGEWVVIP